MILKRSDNPMRAYRIDVETDTGDPIAILHEDDVADLFGPAIYDALKRSKQVRCNVAIWREVQ